VLEFYQGVDLNGNGSAFDHVLFEHDLERGHSENRRLIVQALHSFDSSSWAGVTVDEERWLDLNGDGDAIDWIRYLRDPRTGSLVDSGLERVDEIVEDTLVGAFTAGLREFVHVVDLATGRGRTLDHPLSTPLEGRPEPRVSRAHLTYPTWERRAGIDFNADGDDLDSVVCVYELATEEFVALRAPVEHYCEPYFCEYQYFTYAANDRLVAFTYSEASEGQRDLNGDGDATDWVVQVFGFGRGLRDGILSGPIATVREGTAPFVAGDYAVWAGTRPMGPAARARKPTRSTRRAGPCSISSSKQRYGSRRTASSCSTPWRARAI
jgi:hypothetical protein